jgi:hypothetical protein
MQFFHFLLTVRNIASKVISVIKSTELHERSTHSGRINQPFKITQKIENTTEASKDTNSSKQICILVNNYLL